MVGRVFTAAASDVGVPPHPTSIPSASSPPYDGHYYSGAVYAGSNRNSTELRVTERIPDDFSATHGGNFYYVMLSVWDNAGSYDQLGFADAYGTWGLAYSTTSACGGTYYYSPAAIELQRGAAYTFEMTIAAGHVHMTAVPAGGAVPIWSLTADTGGSEFLLATTYSCGGVAYYDYTDYEEVYETPGPRVPYDLTFDNNSIMGGPASAWYEVAAGRAPVRIEATNVTILNEPYTLATVGGEHLQIVRPSGSPRTFEWNVSVGKLASTSAVSLSVTSLPAEWSGGVSPGSGSAPFAATVSLTIPAGSGGGVYVIELNATNLTGPKNGTRLALTVEIGPTFPVEFTESGLPEDTPWSVASIDTVNTSTTGTVRLFLPNGTYSYVLGGVPGYNQSTVPYHGNFTVAGSSVAFPTIEFVIELIPVVFTERGLPAGIPWVVTLNGSESSVITKPHRTTIHFNVTNGTYAYSIGFVPGWAESNRSSNGSLFVGGWAVYFHTLWYFEMFAVQFTEGGLPAGSNWQISVDSVAREVVTGPSPTTLVFVEANGTHSYSIGHVAGWEEWHPPPNGTFRVSGAIVHEPLAQYDELFDATFSESGLPTGIDWAIHFGNQTRSVVIQAASQTVTFASPNGTIPYAISDVSGWHQSTLPYHGSVTMQGAEITEPTLQYGRVAYSLAVTELGLPAGRVWSVTVDGTTQSLTTTWGNGTLTFTVLNGSNPYSVAGIHGWQLLGTHRIGSFSVAGPPRSAAIFFYAQYEDQLTFRQTGLPGSTPWSVTLTNTSSHEIESIGGSGGSMTFLEPNGTYTYTVGRVSGYSVSPKTGAETLAGANMTVPIAFTPITYPVAFSESGLPSGTRWSLTFFPSYYGITSSSLSSSISFPSVPNGTYTFIQAASTGYVADPVSGTVTVDGTGIDPSISFERGIPVQFYELSLPQGQAWSVTFDGITHSSTGGSIEFASENGTYPFSLPILPGFRASPSSGTVTVNGVLVSVGIIFTTVFYSVTFEETGLTAGTLWSITLGSHTDNSTTSQIGFSERNGTFPFQVAPEPGRNVSEPSGDVRVDGGPVVVSLVFQPAPHAVSFVETGLSPGTPWSVELNGSQRTTTQDWMEFFEPNGTVSFTVLPVPGFRSDPSSGMLRVEGLPITESVSFVPNTYPVTFVESGLSFGHGWSVAIDGVSHPTESDSMTVQLANGTWPYLVTVTGDFRLADQLATGTLTVAGSGVMTGLSFERGASPVLTIKVTGVGISTHRCIVLAIEFCSTVPKVAALHLTPGQYIVGFQALPGFVTEYRAGSAWVLASAVTIQLSHAQTVQIRYAVSVTFVESGLPGGGSWRVKVGGEVWQGNSSEIVAYLPNGSFGFRIPSEQGYGGHPSSGRVVVSGVPISVSVSFRSPARG
ncbi:MAG TPA: hypothetical protein VML94_03230 [Thermoplasmata archaeon]|nr:hypothetical protein [Thermoplasmata archaeon]